jgi:elongation factor 1-beta
LFLLHCSHIASTSHQLTCHSHSPSQADVKVFQQIKEIPAPEKYPYAWRWYNHILTFQGEFDSLPGDPTKEFTAYGPESSELPLNPAKAPEKEAEEDDDEVDLFGSDDEEEDAEAARIKEERLAEYNKKKAGKVKPAAKSIVTLDVKPWGKLFKPPSTLVTVLTICRR